MDNVQNKTAIITGAGSGIGYYITEDLLRKGAKKIAIIDLPVERCYNATVTLQEKFGKDRVIFFPTDVTNMEMYSETFKKIVKEFNGLDILVNNAGICRDRCIEKTFSINVIALIRGSMLAMDYMGKHKGGKGGTIVNIASLAGIFPFFLCPVYSSSKYAVVGFGLSLEKFYDKTGVRILTMCPSFTITAMIIEEDNKLNIIDQDTVNKFEEEFEEVAKDFHDPQSAVHVAQSVVVAIQRGKNGSIWLIKNNEPPCTIKLPPFVVS
ncbi:15-hydroxyprostaglandin dehydrogenase [NAD+] [Trachymyrmex septentrionalis]|uniref:15-hydroxyprostaglandin dehydrogenase [NAD(+)] n=1 Tax=Trachymyrmex septentrionalis TaxID=34720 RepID=A0A195EU87_9HYME|nr:PREDICTED: 15-hydroxyprostaglandin dehydrogenase [NAD(+)]-like [Trachymyrmex septentrionalis]KYN31467.1 15-hydroxyprostaglandin dehydrogenase [NAD+] [Trachymyrmex septentrionalis]